MMSFPNAEKCYEPDCDDVAISDAIQRAFVLLPIAVPAAGVALINDTSSGNVDEQAGPEASRCRQPATGHPVGVSGGPSR